MKARIAFFRNRRDDGLFPSDRWDAIGGLPTPAKQTTAYKLPRASGHLATGPDASRRAFTLIEAMVSIALAAMAGTALLLGSTSSLQSTDESLKRTIASGLAQQLMDEVAGNPYCEAGQAYAVPIACTSYESQGTGRERYDDIGDYNGVRTQPPKDLWGVALGKDDGLGGQRYVNFQALSGFLENLRQEIDVTYVSETNPTAALPAGQTSDYRAVEVRIMYVDPRGGSRQLAKLRRVVAYVPTL
jgi:type II secretory pathway pseudopilin PulG